MLPGSSFPKEVLEDLMDVAEDKAEDVCATAEETLLANSFETTAKNIGEAFQIWVHIRWELFPTSLFPPQRLLGI